MYIHFLIRTKKNHNICILLMCVCIYVYVYVCWLTRIAQFNAFQSFLFDCFAFSVCWRFYSAASHSGRNYTKNATQKRERQRERQRVLLTTKLSQHGSEFTHTLKRPALSVFVLALSHAGKKQVNGLYVRAWMGLHMWVRVWVLVRYKPFWSWTLSSALPYGPLLFSNALWHALQYIVIYWKRT